MAIRFNSSESLNNYFNTSLGNRKKTIVNLFDNIDLNEHKIIQSGTYKKLLKSYYNVENSEEVEETSMDKLLKDNNEVNKTNNAIIKNSEKVNKSIDNLSNAKYEESNRKEITKEINNFVNSYNKVIESAKKSTDKDIHTKEKWMNNYMNAFKDELEGIGISVEKGNTIKLDEEKIKSVEMEKLKDMFVGKKSFGSNLVTISAIDTYL